jgi:diguanylate cyclase (GGDEF)-like protein
MRNRSLLFFASALLCALPALWLRVPEAAAAFAASGPSQDNWRLGLGISLALLALAAWRLNQTRLVAVAIGLAASAQWLWVAVSQLPPRSLAPEDAWLAVVPTGLALALLPKEARLLSQRSALRLALLLLPALVFWAVWNSDSGSAAQVLGWRLIGPLKSWHPSHAAHVSLLLLGLVLWLGLDPKLAPAQIALGGSILGQAVLAWATAGNPGAGSLGARAWLASHLAQAACLLFALFLMYWQRVYLDELTGIPNRRALDERLSHLDGAYSLAMVDIDHFKKFNDSYGHDQGDDVLRMVGKHLAEQTQQRAFRYGGEEFCVLLPGEGSDAAFDLMDGVRESLARHRFNIRLPQTIRAKTSEEDRGTLKAKTESVKVTISVGVARPDKKRPDPGAVMKLADEGLYKAKEAGRNNVQQMN